MKDTPSINQKSIDLTNDRRKCRLQSKIKEEGGYGSEHDSKKVHARLYSQDLQKHKVAKKVEYETTRTVFLFTMPGIHSMNFSLCSLVCILGSDVDL